MKCIGHCKNEEALKRAQVNCKLSVYSTTIKVVLRYHPSEKDSDLDRKIFVFGEMSTGEGEEPEVLEIFPLNPVDYCSSSLTVVRLFS